MDARDWIIAIVTVVGFIAVSITHVLSYQRGYDDGRECAVNFYRILLGKGVWLWVNGRFYPYEIEEEELRDVVVTDRIHGGSFKWPTK